MDSACASVCFKSTHTHPQTNGLRDAWPWKLNHRGCPVAFIHVGLPPPLCPTVIAGPLAERCEVQLDGYYILVVFDTQRDLEGGKEGRRGGSDSARKQGRNIVERKECDCVVCVSKCMGEACGNGGREDGGCVCNGSSLKVSIDELSFL